MCSPYVLLLSGHMPKGQIEVMKSWLQFFPSLRSEVETTSSLHIYNHQTTFSLNYFHHTFNLDVPAMDDLHPLAALSANA